MSRTEDLPSTDFEILALVHKLEGGSGGPARVVALLESGAAGDLTMSSGSARIATYISILSALVLVYLI